MKKNSLYIALGLGLAILLSSFKKKKIIQPSVIEQNGKPSGQRYTNLIPGGVVYDRNMNVMYTNNNDSYLQMSITGETSATYNIVYGMNFGNGAPGIVFKNETKDFI
jgi:hypothetical protein